MIRYASPTAFLGDVCGVQGFCRKILKQKISNKEKKSVGVTQAIVLPFFSPLSWSLDFCFSRVVLYSFCFFC